MRKIVLAVLLCAACATPWFRRGEPCPVGMAEELHYAGALTAQRVCRFAPFPTTTEPACQADAGPCTPDPGVR